MLGQTWDHKIICTCPPLKYTGEQGKRIRDVNRIRPGLFSLSPGQGWLRGLDPKHQGYHDRMKQNFAIYYSKLKYALYYKSVPDAKFEFELALLV